jgi:heme/copper-type cytochrome/quinol oxidase subunit 3
MGRLPYSHPGACGPPAPFWQAVAAVAALAAAATLGLHPNAQFVAAGLLAAGAACTAWYEALLRRRNRSSDIGGLITTVLAVCFVLVCVLGLAARIRH